MPREGQYAFAREPDTLALEHEALKPLVAHAVGTWTGAALSVYDAMQGTLLWSGRAWSA